MSARRLRAALLLALPLCVLFLVNTSARDQGAPGSTTVYVTQSGTKYHQAGCSSLSKSAIPMRLDEAASRYGPCSRCRPPVLQPSASAAPKSATAASTLVSGAANPEVYTAVGGAVYHLSRECVGLKGRQVATHKLSEVQTAQFGLCSTCAKAAVPETSTPAAVSSAPQPAPVAGGRCQATTKKGTQCSRQAQPGSKYCWQHQR